MKQFFFVFVMLLTQSILAIENSITFSGVSHYCTDDKRSIKINDKENGLSFFIGKTNSSSLCTVYFDIHYPSVEDKAYGIIAHIESSSELNINDVYLALESQTQPRIFATPEALGGNKYLFKLNIPTSKVLRDARVLLLNRSTKSIEMTKINIESRGKKAKLTDELRSALDIVSKNSFPPVADSKKEELFDVYRELITNTNNTSWDVFIATRNILSLLNLNHSFPVIEKPNTSNTEGDEYNCGLSISVKKYDSVLYIGVEGTNIKGKTDCEPKVFARKATELKKVLESSDPKGLVVDIRRYSGGNLWPVLSLLGSVFYDGPLIGFVKPDKNIDWVSKRRDWFYEGEQKIVESFQNAKYKGKLEAWICKRTLSSGEAVAIALKSTGATLKGVKTGGFGTSNKSFKISDSNSVMLTYAKLVDKERSGATVNNEVIPDIETENRFCDLEPREIINS